MSFSIWFLPAVNFLHCNFIPGRHQRLHSTTVYLPQWSYILPSCSTAAEWFINLTGALVLRLPILCYYKSK